MEWLSPSRMVLLPLLIGSLAYVILRIRRGRLSTETLPDGVNFLPSIGFAWQDGFKSVALLLANKSGIPVWAEEVEIALTNLIADQQTSEAPCHEVHKILQFVSPRDLLPISLVETIYAAAGKPQRNYSCILSSVVRYRVGEKRFQKAMPSYKMKMRGLTVSSIRHERKFTPDFAAKSNS